MSLRLLPLGVGDAFSALSYSTCLALECEGRWLLLECPHPIRKMMREGSASAGLDLDVDRVEAVAVTHLHADHSSGLEGLGYYSHFALGRRAVLLAHPAVSARLWERLAAGMDSLLGADGGPVTRTLEDWFELVPLDPARAVRRGPFQVECRPTRHHIPTTALRVLAGGACVAYSADTAFDPALVDWLAEADLVLHETNHGPGHTDFERLAALPAALRARMRLVHAPDGFDAGGRIEPLRQGRLYDVG